MCRVVRLFAAAFLMLAPLLAVTSGAAAREVVPLSGYAAGTIIVRTSERRLYYALGNGEAIRYPVGVGRVGMQWSGHSRVDGVYYKPAWAPPPIVKRDHPSMPNLYPGGSPRNPMGVAALTLNGGEYAIHGTNNPGSVGKFVSYGCIRMYNRDILDLMNRVYVGTPVEVTK
jgi:lipoprotein-anchoring transpeptidase ErfK/SrfK